MIEIDVFIIKNEPYFHISLQLQFLLMVADRSIEYIDGR